MIKTRFLDVIYFPVQDPMFAVLSVECVVPVTVFR